MGGQNMGGQNMALNYCGSSCSCKLERKNRSRDLFSAKTSFKLN